jgi:DNA-binding transcriptional LysR family regulator
LARSTWRVKPVARIESFSSAVQLARAGFGHALVPRGVAVAMGVPEDVLLEVPGLERPIGVCARVTTWERPAVRRFVDALRSGS